MRHYKTIKFTAVLFLMLFVVLGFFSTTIKAGNISVDPSDVSPGWPPNTCKKCYSHAWSVPKRISTCTCAAPSCGLLCDGTEAQNGCEGMSLDSTGLYDIHQVGCFLPFSELRGPAKTYVLDFTSLVDITGTGVAPDDPFGVKNARVYGVKMVTIDPKDYGVSHLVCKNGKWVTPDEADIDTYADTNESCILNPLFKYRTGANVMDEGVPTGIGCFPTTAKGISTAFLRIFMMIAVLVCFGGIIISLIRITTQGDNPEVVKEEKGKIGRYVIGFVVIVLSVFLFRFVGINILNLPEFGAEQIEDIGS